jgi:hypothetical protein
MDRFRCESVTLRTHWVLVVMDQYTRRIIGFGVHAGTVESGYTCARTPYYPRPRLRCEAKDRKAIESVLGVFR